MNKDNIIVFLITKHTAYKMHLRNQPLLSLRLSYWVIARSQLPGYLRPRKIGGYPCCYKEFVLNEGLPMKGAS